jgi:dienelactone hydrolase
MRAQTAYPGTRYRDYARCLPDYLRELARRSYELRAQALAALTTPEAIAQRQRWVRETFWKLVGGQPDHTPLNPRVLGSFERPGYRVEKIVYESRPGLPVPANLYIPARGQPPFPGILFQMGHAGNGKAYDQYQKCCQGLARLGYLTLAFDPMGQGERIYYPDSSRVKTRLASSDDEHTVPGKQMLLVGDTSTRLQVWDAVRSLDYLAAHPMVDPKRLGSSGNSGGGTLTMLLAAVDDRLAAAVVSSGNTENFACEDFNPPGSTDDAEQNFIMAGPLGFDRWDLLYPLAPKPLLVLVSDKDFFGTYSPSYIRDGWAEFQKLQSAYGVLGRADHIAWAGTPLPHGLAYDMRMLIYRWFERWLKTGAAPIAEEPEGHPEADRTLWVTQSGSVTRDFAGKTPFELTRERAARITRTPLRLDALLGIDRPTARPRVTVLSRARSGVANIEAIEIPSADKVWLPAWIFRPRAEPARQQLIVVLEPAGRNARWGESGLYQELAAAGATVCAVDLRGIGDLAPEVGRGSPRYTRSHQDEEHYAWACLMLGKPLVGQRITDILAVVEALGRPVRLAALGKMTVPALIAAALEPRIESLYLAGGLVSFRAVIETENYNHPLANFAWRWLEHTDLPELAASLKHVVIAGAVDGAGRRAPLDIVRASYPNADVRAEPRWDRDSLLR